MEADASGSQQSVEVELRGLSVYTHHGVSEAEREVGQRFEIDVTLDLARCDALHTDRIEDTADYGEVATIVARAATERGYRTLERLCQVICERLAERFRCEAVRVRAAKPEPPMAVAIEEVAVEVSYERAPEPEPDEPGEDQEETGG